MTDEGDEDQRDYHRILEPLTRDELVALINQAQAELLGRGNLLAGSLN